MQEACARHMLCLVLGAPAHRIGQIVSAVEHDPVGISEMLSEDFGADEREENHVLIII